MSEQTVDLTRVWLVLWRSRWRILAVAFAAGVLGFVLSLLRTNLYTANAALYIQDIRIGSSQSARDEERAISDILVGFLSNDHTLQRVIDECGLGEEGPGYTIRDLRKLISADVGRSEDSIKISVTMPSQGLALRVAESLISYATRFNEDLLRGETDATRRVYRARVDAVREKLAGRADAWRRSRQEARLESDEERIQQLELSLRRAEDDYGEVEALMEQRQAEYESYAAALEVEPPTRALRQSLAENPVLAEISGEFDAAADDSKELLGLELESEIENPVYSDLKVKAADATAEYYGARAKLDTLRRQTAELRERIDVVQDRYNSTYPREIWMREEFDAARLALADAVRAASDEFREPRLLRILPPVRPDAPSGPNRFLVALGAFFVGGVLASAVIIGRLPSSRFVRESP